MPRQLPADCLNEIFEYLEEDMASLRSCLLVNRLWCEITVRILWKNVWSFPYSVPDRAHVPLGIISALVACLPNESKDLLYKNGIFIAASTWKPSLFNYTSFCKVLSIHEIDKMIQHVLENQQPITSRSLNYNKYLLSQEIFKMFMNQKSSLKSLDYSRKVQNVMFTNLPGAKNCLTDLTVLKCSSDICSEFFYQLSQICYNVQSLTIEFGDEISNGLADLISLQNNLKHVTLISSRGHEGENEEILTSLTKFSLTLTKLRIENFHIPLSFISMFINLQELVLSDLDDFNATFPRLKVLKFLHECPRVETLIKFLEINGRDLKELHIENNNNLLNLAIAQYCPNLKSLYTKFNDNEIETLKVVLNGCQYLESVKVWYYENYLNEKDLFDILAKYSPKNFYELKIYYVFDALSKILSEELEEFFINWKNRIPQKSLSFIIIKGCCVKSLEAKKENMEVIEKYKKLGVIKNFGTEKLCKEN